MARGAPGLFFFFICEEKYKTGPLDRPIWLKKLITTLADWPGAKRVEVRTEEQMEGRLGGLALSEQGGGSVLLLSDGSICRSCPTVRLLGEMMRLIRSEMAAEGVMKLSLYSRR